MRWALLLILAASVAASEKDEFFEKKVRPLLAAKCHSCHSAKMQMGDLNLASAEGAAKVVVAGDAAVSPLYQAVAHMGKVKMPPTGKLEAAEVEALRNWINMGAPWPAGAAKAAEPAERHWAFQPVGDPKPPQVRETAWVRNDIDRFILSRLEAKGLRPAPAADKLTLLRRVTYNLTGLPPTPDEIDAFLADFAPDAFAKVVDRLLASPHYGERWGRHWLDVARYADSTGMDEDHIYPHAWRYRDYVVQAFNEDLPYDRFVKEQVAGDLLPPRKPGASKEPGIVATGFLALGPKPLAQQDRVLAVYEVVDEQIDSVSKAFLGLTVACARCHDHKFDPILTKDYYSLASIFASTISYRNMGRPGAVSYLHVTPLDPDAYGRYQAHRWRMYGKQLEMEEAHARDSAREWSLERPKIADYLTAAWRTYKRAGEHNLDPREVDKWLCWLLSTGDEARQGYLKKWFEADESTIGDVAREYQEQYLKSAEKWDNRLDGWRKRFAIELVQERTLPARPVFSAEEDPFFAAATSDGGPMDFRDTTAVAVLRREWKQLEDTLPEEPPLANAVCEGPSVEQRVFVRGDLHSPGDPVPKRFPIVLAGDSQPTIASGSGRLELARFLTDPANPLTARVMVNRIWQWHFGEALVRTPNNWGTTGESPTHPELLDWLAKRFIESGWSVKAMHRLILQSSAYQMSAQASPETREADPANRLWSRFNRVRMSVEQIRDSFLALGGSLDATVGGSLLPGKGNRPRVDPDKMTRRTLYIPVRRGSIPTVLATFDYGDATTSSEGRSRTNVAPQALFMLNSAFANEQALGFAKRLLDEPGLSDRKRVERAYRIAFTRNPDANEIDEALAYTAELARRLDPDDAQVRAWQSLCHVLLSANEFLYLN